MRASVNPRRGAGDPSSYLERRIMRSIRLPEEVTNMGVSVESVLTSYRESAKEGT